MITYVRRRPIDLRQLLPIFLGILLSAQVFAEARIDARNEKTFDVSLQAMKRELPPTKLAQLNGAIMALPFAGMQSFKDTPPDGVVKLDIKKLDGMTASEIIELGRETVTVKFRVGPPPGLPEKFRGKLQPAAGRGRSETDAGSLIGTAWTITDNINGNLSEEHVKLLPEGKIDDGATNGRWEQIGSAVRITFNDNYAVYLGSLHASNELQGTAGNVDGLEWTWVAYPTEGH